MALSPKPQPVVRIVETERVAAREATAAPNEDRRVCFSAESLAAGLLGGGVAQNRNEMDESAGWDLRMHVSPSDQQCLGEFQGQEAWRQRTSKRCATPVLAGVLEVRLEREVVTGLWR